jgi:hypothetical protein
MPSTISDRLYASLPANDPRFTELRAFLAPAVQSDAPDPTERILGEYALLGFLLTTGRLNLGALNGGAAASMSASPSASRFHADSDDMYLPTGSSAHASLPEPGMDHILEEQRQIEIAAQSLGMFDD